MRLLNVVAASRPRCPLLRLRSLTQQAIFSLRKEGAAFQYNRDLLVCEETTPQKLIFSECGFVLEFASQDAKHHLEEFRVVVFEQKP